MFQIANHLFVGIKAESNSHELLDCKHILPFTFWPITRRVSTVRFGSTIFSYIGCTSLVCNSQFQGLCCIFLSLIAMGTLLLEFYWLFPIYCSKFWQFKTTTHNFVALLCILVNSESLVYVWSLLSMGTWILEFHCFFPIYLLKFWQFGDYLS